MPRPFASRVILTPEAREALEKIRRAHSTPQALAFRCQVVLFSAAGDHPTNQDIADQLGCDRHTVGMWRERYVQQGFQGLQDAPRSGRPRSFSPR